MHDSFGMSWGIGWSWIIGIIVIAVTIWIIVKVVNQSKNHYQSKSKSPQDI
jgi:large-conductance mechanosensitive channel